MCHPVLSRKDGKPRYLSVDAFMDFALYDNRSPEAMKDFVMDLKPLKQEMKEKKPKPKEAPFVNMSVLANIKTNTEPKGTGGSRLFARFGHLVDLTRYGIFPAKK